jgi:uridine monophosphate synthetase
MAVKKSNLCLSADVSTTNQLVHLTGDIGLSIVVLETYCAPISN